ncbi:MAG: glutaredoxin family protein [Pseudomonadota bacterium]|jgi:hypothetical protein
MKLRMPTLVVLLALATGAAAQTLYRWVDREGKVHYSDQPPPADARKVHQPRVGGNVVQTSTLPYATQKARELYPVTLYTSAECKSECDMARGFLTRRGIPFSETVLATPEDHENFKKLFKADGVFLPSLAVGSRRMQGYEEGAWNGLLDDAGYPRSVPPGAGAPAAPQKAAAPDQEAR